jgi:hypothetical protein
MKSLTHVLPIATTFAAIFLLTGCTKHLDLDKTSGELRYCPIEKVIGTLPVYGKPLDSIVIEGDFSYNTAGNPIAITSPRFLYGPPIFYYFRYDRQNRLTDFQSAFYPTTEVVVWHRYSYLRNGDILDSEYVYVDTPYTASHPPVSFTGGRIFTYHLDGKGRVVTSTETDPLSPGTVFSVFAYVYDAAGDLVQPSGEPSAAYDDKISPLQTNNVWMFLSLNYSVHNAVAYNGIPFVVFTYDPYGLPTEMVRLPNTFFFNETGFLGQYYGDHTSISYGCDLGNRGNEKSNE